MGKSDKYEKILLILWFALNIVIGVFIMQDFGMSVDERNHFLYAESSIKAYASFFGQLYEPAYGPGNLPYYGPALLIFSYFPIHFLTTIFPDILPSDFWHFSYFIVFQLSGFSLYLLTKRWFKQWTAWSVLILFTTQPLLWGHAFINPKDIPFTFFFIFSILTGLWMVDANGGETPTFSLKEYHLWFLRTWNQVLPEKRKNFSFWIKINGVFLIFIWTFSSKILEAIIRFFYNAPESSWANNIFTQQAGQSGIVSVENYIHKAQALFLRAEYLFLFLNFLIVGFILSRLLSQNFTQINLKEWVDKKNFKERIHIALRELKKEKLTRGCEKSCVNGLS